MNYIIHRKHRTDWALVQDDRVIQTFEYHSQAEEAALALIQQQPKSTVSVVEFWGTFVCNEKPGAFCPES
jgi:hypothetical protein